MVQDRKKMIGDQYEVLVGMEFEKKGYTVLYTGLAYGYEDKGIDLVAYNSEKAILIQCKWRDVDLIDSDDLASQARKFDAFRENAHLSCPIENVLVTSNGFKTFAYNTSENLGIRLMVWKATRSDCNWVSKQMIDEKRHLYRTDIYSLVRAKLADIPVSAPVVTVYEHPALIPERTEAAVGGRGRIFVIVALAVALVLFYLFRPVYYAPYSGVRYHVRETCDGLENAVDVERTTRLNARIGKGLTPCGYCRRVVDVW